jgi:hypothetical protein
MMIVTGKKLTDKEAHKQAVDLEQQILRILNGHVDFVVMTALTYTAATLIVQLPIVHMSTNEQMDHFEGQLRTAVALLLKHKKLMATQKEHLQ